MPDVVKRGYMPSDDKEFIDQIEKLREAGEELFYLINRGYQIKPASTFVGNHHLLSERQRLALVRSISPKGSIEERVAKEVHELKDSVVYIDTFNTVITLEIAFSGSTLLSCMDGTVRDLAGLRGTYRIIDKTDLAVETIRKILEAEGVKEAHFLIDAPISNSGRLSSKIEDMFEKSPVEAVCEVINDVDKNLYDRESVITSDAIILDNCRSWYNLTRKAIQAEIGAYPFVIIMK